MKLNAEPSADDTYYGLHNRIFSTRSSNNYGIFNEVYGDLGGYNYGTYNRAFHDGSGRNIGLLNYARHYGTGENIALYNLMWYDGSGDKTGMYTFLGDDTYANRNSTSSMFGTRTLLRCKYFPKVYGHHVQITNSGSNSTARDLFGVFILADGYDKDNMYGIYSHVKQDENNSDQAYAGYFTGDVVENGSMIFTSDARLKENITKLDGALSIINKLNPTSYTFLDGNRFGYDPDRLTYGFLAQEVAEVLPELVVDIRHPEVVEYAQVELSAAEVDPLDSTALQSAKVLNSSLNKDPLEQTASQSQDQIRHQAQTLKGIKYIELIPILTQAIKEQQLQLDALSSLNPLTKSATANKQGTDRLVNKLTDELAHVRDSSLALAGRVVELQTNNIELRNSQSELVAMYTALREEHQLVRQRYTNIATELRELREALVELRECTDCINSNMDALPLEPPKASVVCYPNPADSQVTIRYDGARDYTVRLFTVDGQLVGTRQAITHTMRLDVGELPAGNYTIEVSRDEQLIERLPLIVQ